jgi:hypothetical protein
MNTHQNETPKERWFLPEKAAPDFSVSRLPTYRASSLLASRYKCSPSDARNHGPAPSNSSHWSLLKEEGHQTIRKTSRASPRKLLALKFPFQFQQHRQVTTISSYSVIFQPDSLTCLFGLLDSTLPYCYHLFKSRYARAVISFTNVRLTSIIVFVLKPPVHIFASWHRSNVE